MSRIQNKEEIGVEYIKGKPYYAKPFTQRDLNLFNKNEAYKELAMKLFPEKINRDLKICENCGNYLFKTQKCNCKN